MKTAGAYPMNPWLAALVRKYRQSHSPQQLRDEYMLGSVFHSGCSWDRYLAESALEAEMLLGPFLGKRLACLDLPEPERRGLYVAGVDCAADLVQMTREEIVAVAGMYGFDAGTVIDFMADNGYGRYSCPSRTYKLSGLAVKTEDGWSREGTWTIPSPGAGFVFRTSRPSLFPEWIDMYVRMYGAYENEDSDKLLFLSVPAPDLEGGDVPLDYSGFFDAAERFWTYYRKCCIQCGISPRIPVPVMPSADVQGINMEALKAVVDIMERTSLMKRGDIETYLAARYDLRLSMIEHIETNADFKNMLESHLEIMVYLGNIAIYLGEILRGSRRFAMKPGPVDKRFAEMVMRLRSRYTGEQLREGYLLASRQERGLSWREFISRLALLQA